MRHEGHEEPKQVLGAVALAILDEGVDLDQLGVLHPLEVIQELRAQRRVEGLAAANQQPKKGVSFRGGGGG